MNQDLPLVSVIMNAHNVGPGLRLTVTDDEEKNDMRDDDSDEARHHLITLLS